MKVQNTVNHMDREVCIKIIEGYFKDNKPWLAVVKLYELITVWQFKRQITDEEMRYYYAFVEGYAFGIDHAHNEE